MRQSLQNPPGGEVAVLRDVTTADYPRICELSNLTMVEPVTIQILEERDRKTTDRDRRHRLVAVCEDRVVAYGGIFRWAGMPHHNAYLTMHVDPGHRRKGIATALLEELGKRAAADGVETATVAVRDDRPEGQAFVAARGFRFTQHLVDSLLDLSSFDVRAFQPLIQRLQEQGIRFVDFDDFGDTVPNRRLVHELHNECDADTPGIEDWGLSEFEDFQADTFDSSRHHPKGLVLALQGEEPVGLSWVGPVEGDLWGTHFSGVRKGYRGRRIGLAAKAIALENAIKLGAANCRAQNDTRNGPMLAINRALGFQPQFGWIYHQRNLNGATP